MEEEINNTINDLKRENSALKSKLSSIEDNNKKQNKFRFWVIKKLGFFWAGPNLKNSTINLLNEVKNGKIKRDSLVDVSVQILWRFTRIGVFIILASILPYILLFIQNQKIENQNSLFAKQNLLMEKQILQIEINRRKNSIDDIFSVINDELKLSKDSAISNPTISRIVDLSHDFTPYKNLIKGDSLNLSPERGLLLNNLMRKNINKTSLNRIFSLSNFSYSDLKFSQFNDYDLSEINLSNSDLSESKLQNITFINSNLESINFTKSEINNCNFMTANIASSKFDKAKISSSNFNQVIGSNNLFDGVSVTNSDFRGIISSTKHLAIEAVIAQLRIRNRVFNESNNKAYENQIEELIRLGIDTSTSNIKYIKIDSVLEDYLINGSSESYNELINPHLSSLMSDSVWINATDEERFDIQRIIKALDDLPEEEKVSSR